MKMPERVSEEGKLESSASESFGERWVYVVGLVEEKRKKCGSFSK